jgi:hypothetical protein
MLRQEVLGRLLDLAVAALGQGQALAARRRWQKAVR